MLQKIFDIPRRLKILLGCVLFLILGRDRFYILAQKSGLLSELGRNFATDQHVRKVVQGFVEIQRDKDTSQQTATSIKQYSDASLGGYGDYHFNTTGDSHNDVPDQLRGVVLPTVEAQIMKSEEPANIYEIGTGNGDILEHLAQKFPNHKFTGFDFNVENAVQKHGGKHENLSFEKGYALDFISEGRLAKKSIIFASSTIVVLSPAELRSYLEAVKEAEIGALIFSEPLTRKYSPFDHPEPKSIHMAEGMWGHNYKAYFEEYGFSVYENEVVTYKGHKKRPEIYMNVVACEL